MLSDPERQELNAKPAIVAECWSLFVPLGEWGYIGSPPSFLRIGLLKGNILNSGILRALGRGLDEAYAAQHEGSA
jgi:hypothetical protein